MNKASGGDGIPVDLFQILKDAAAFNMSANLENSAVATGLEKVTFHSNPKKGSAKNVQTTAQLHSSHTEGAWWAAIYGVAQSQTRLK